MAQLNLFDQDTWGKIDPQDKTFLPDGRTVYRVDGPFALRRTDITEMRCNDGFIVEDLHGALSALPMEAARSIGIV